MRRIWKHVRRAWMILGTTFFVVFTTWSLLAYRASSAARAAIRSDAIVDVRDGDGFLEFVPVRTSPAGPVGFLFVAGALVNPVAYAPLARSVAEAGHRAVIVELPRRGAFGGATEPILMNRISALLQDSTRARTWVVAGHSRGGVVISTLMTVPQPHVAGMVLIGTSHPRDVDLSTLNIPVTKVAGTRDGLASREEVEANRRLLPVNTTWIWIEGGNHSQFGWYGFQPGDRRPRISAAEQRRLMIDAVLDVLRTAAAR